MASRCAREMPIRTARTEAINRLLAHEDIFPENALEDDAATEVDDASNEVDDYHGESDENLDASDLEADNSSSEEDIGIDETDDEALVSSSGLEWLQRSPIAPQGRPPNRNQCNISRTGFAAALRPCSRKEAFLVIMQQFVDTAVVNTNTSLRRLSQNGKWRPTDEDEILAFLGLHLLAGVLKAHHRDLRELWSERDGHVLFRATMSCERFLQLKKAFRFDDSRRRDRSDKLAPIRHVVDEFNMALKSLYTPGPYLCVDEMLVEYHGRVQFRQYMPAKPGKFGIKIYWCVDAETTMPLKCLVYIGKGTLSENEARPFAHAIVIELVRDYLDRGRNITGDNFFTSGGLICELLQRNTTYVGTVRQNNRDLPPKSKCLAGRVRGDSRHFYSESMTLCSFWDKRQRPVMLFSSMHIGPQTNTNDREAGKPEMVVTYNQSKGGVDNLDKLVRGYSSKRKCRRWPYSVALVLVDVAVICAHKMMVSQSGCDDNHYIFKRELAFELCQRLMERRVRSPRLRESTRKALTQLDVHAPPSVCPVSATHACVKAAKPGRCSLCPRASDTKTRQLCWQCQKHVCWKHQHVFCDVCYRV